MDKIENLLPIHQNIRQKLDYFYQQNKIPHIIFHGSSGSGKKTLVYEFLYKIYRNDKQIIKNNVMFVNCCHGKGIKFIREDLKFFAKTNLQTNAGVKFKSIVLFNADSLTTDAQSALRRCIELFSYNTRFFIIVENKSKLLNPILSRFCEIYVPEYLENGKIVNLQQYVLNKKINTSSLEQTKKDFIQKILDKVDAETTYENLAETSSIIYEKGYSCLDLIDCICSNNERWSGEERAKIMMCFHKIKAEYRCEKLLMLYMLDFMFKGGTREPRELVDIGFL
jgi:replication-associated recombination protein RarA